MRVWIRWCGVELAFGGSLDSVVRASVEDLYFNFPYRCYFRLSIDVFVLSYRCVCVEVAGAAEWFLECERISKVLDCNELR